MRIHFDQLKESGLSLEFEEQPEFFPVLKEMIESGECVFLAPIKTRLQAVRIAELVEVEGSVETTVRLTCSRCLKRFKTPLHSQFALTYTKAPPAVPQAADGQEIELSAADMGMVHFKGEVINLQDSLQEQLVLAFPLRPLCRETCKGLCPRCGADLNTSPCNCAPPPFNSRFAALKDLKLGRT
ncbi:MAG: DUF177 domain-containing protein [Desulfobacterales bacterium]|nr:MAG: DUF177 domain-containing protein [Desulfobacterales bacterium]